MSKADLEDRVHRGTLAKQELDQLGTVFARMREIYFNQWETSASEDQDKREKIFLCIGMVSDVEKALRSLADDALVADTELEFLNTQAPS